MGIWIGDPPELCGVCEREIVESFVHVHMEWDNGESGWHILCEECANPPKDIVLLEKRLYVKREHAPHITVWEERSWTCGS